MAQAPPLIAGLDAAVEHEASTMSRKLCVAAALLCVIVVLVGGETNTYVLKQAKEFGMLTAILFAVGIMLLLHIITTTFLVSSRRFHQRQRHIVLFTPSQE